MGRPLSKILPWKGSDGVSSRRWKGPKWHGDARVILTAAVGALAESLDRKQAATTLAPAREVPV
jgi:hypothetical protein